MSRILFSLLLCEQVIITLQTDSVNAQVFQSDVISLSDSLIDQLSVKSRFFGYQSAVDRDLTGGTLAYDYSVHLIKDVEQDTYKLFTGGRYRSLPIDGDHIFEYTSPNGLGDTWTAVPARAEFTGYEQPSPVFHQGRNEGLIGQWDSGQYLEPEVIKVGNTYYMWSNVDVHAGTILDYGGVAETKAARIQLHISEDGGNTFTRWADTPGPDGIAPKRGVVVNIDNPTVVHVGHQEMLYRPDDSDSKPFWMYVRWFENGDFKGHVRIKSDDPTTFDWQEKEVVAGLAQLGNQIGYISDAGGAPLMVRITFTSNGSRQVPTLQFSRDGLSWNFGSDSRVELPGSLDNANNRSTYFLGMSTLNGTGELEKVGPETYRVIYGATTANSSVSPDIFYSEIGVGELFFKIPNDLPGDFDRNGRVNGLDFLKLQRSDASNPFWQSDLADWQENYGNTSASTATLTLKVDITTGQATLFNESEQHAIEIEGYDIFSESGSLLPDDGNWSSLDDQDLAGGDWRESNANSNRLAELKESNSTIFGINGSTHFDLGTLFDYQVGTQDLLLQILIAGDASPTLGSVIYFVPGDFNGDLKVDNDDLIDPVYGWHVRNGIDLDNSDFLDWRRNLGFSAYSDFGALVPEPTVLVLLVMGLMGCCQNRGTVTCCCQSNKLIYLSSRKLAAR